MKFSSSIVLLSALSGCSVAFSPFRLSSVGRATGSSALYFQKDSTSTLNSTHPVEIVFDLDDKKVDEKRETLDSLRTILAPDGSPRPVSEIKRNEAATNRKPRVLFFHGEYTNEHIAEHALKLSRWDKLFDFVIPGATNVGTAAPPELFNSLGLEALERVGQYNRDDKFWTWGSRYELMKKNPSDVPQDLQEKYQQSTAAYVQQLDEAFGPFDGVMGFCEGGAALNCALGMRQDGKLNGALDSVKFFIHTAPWTTPLAGKYQGMQKSIPALSIYGINDPNEGFPEAYAKYPSGFNGYFEEHKHQGQHNYVHVSSDLLVKVENLLEVANKETVEKEDSSDSGNEDARVIEVIQEVKCVTVTEKQSTLLSDLEFDSIHVQELVLSLEDEFGIVFSTSFEEKLSKYNCTVQDVIEIVEEILAGQECD